MSRFVIVFLCILLPAVSRAAQLGSASVTGVVRDASGVPAPGATVTLIAVATNRSRMVVTGEGGAYTLPGLAPGAYVVRVELSGFRPLTRDGIRLATGET